MTEVLVDDIGKSKRFLRAPTASGQFRIYIERFDAILCANQLCARITLGADSILVGNKAASEPEPVEFVFTSDATLRRLFRRMSLFDFTMAYIDGHMKIKGSISKAVDVLDALNISTDRPQSILEFAKALVFRTSKALVPTIAKRFEALDHYSQSATAYELFLDHHMQYTCAYFEAGQEDIDQAQIAKFQLIERLVRAHAGTLSGKQHLDIGCGWGGMVSYFHREFGTKSVGNTNCAEQMDYAKQRYGCEIILGDFSDLLGRGDQFDLITIVGMIEHLTPYRRSQLLKVAHGLLKPGGLMYLQCITKPDIWIGGDAYRIVQREVFPGHFLETSKQTEDRLRSSGFTILEQMDHGMDYGRTASCWAEKIQENEAALIDILGARRYRMYLGYLAFASKLFSTGRGNLMRYMVKKTEYSH